MDDQPENEIDHPRLPANGTDAYEAYINDYHRLIHFVGFIASLATREDQKAVKAAEVLLEIHSGDSDYEARYRRTLEQKGVGALKTLHTFDQLILETMMCRGVDNFLTYLSQLLSLIFRTKPETLRSNDQARIDFVLQFNTMDDLVDALAEKKVTELSYAGMRQLADYLRDRLGLELFPDEAALERAVFLIEVRNLIAHNRAVVNNIFLNKVRSSKEPTGKLGEPVELHGDNVFDGMKFLADTAGEIDTRAASKFDLPQPHSYQQ